MGNVAISARGVGKRYRVGTRARYRSLRDSLANAIPNLFRAATDRNQPSTFWALEDVSFDIHHGEVRGLVGRNGAGNRTRLKILFLICERNPGEIAMQGRVGSLLEVGTGFHP